MATPRSLLADTCIGWNYHERCCSIMAFEGCFFLKISVYAQVGTVLGQHLVLMSCSIFMWMKTEGILILRWTR